jgi:hypothetical protein
VATGEAEGTGFHTLEYIIDLDGDGGIDPDFFTINIDVSEAPC